MYTFSAISPAAIPVSLDKSSIAFFISSIGISVSSAIVDTLAIESSKSVAIFPVATPSPVMAAVTGMSLFPAFSKPAPKFFIFSPVSASF